MRPERHVSGGLSFAAAIAVAAALAGSPGAGAAVCGGPAAAQMRCLVNVVRRDHGLAPLRASRLLNRSSILRLNAMERCDSFSHTPCGQSFVAPFVRVGYLRRSGSVGENLAWGQSTLGSPQSVLEAWLRSPEHRANLLGTGWRDFGVVVVHVASFAGQRDVTLWVTQFGRRP